MCGRDETDGKITSIKSLLQIYLTTQQVMEFSLKEIFTQFHFAFFCFEIKAFLHFLAVLAPNWRNVKHYAHLTSRRNDKLEAYKFASEYKVIQCC